MIKKKTDRRTFLKQSLAASAGLALPLFIPASALGRAGHTAPSDRIRMAAIGTGGMGMHDMKNFMGRKEVQIVAVCDVDKGHAANAQKEAGLEAKDVYGDYREALLRKDVDAVTVVTPDHWHVPISIAAVRAGKDVYCEKPLTLTIAEGRELADTVAQYGAVLQVGSQQRSDRNFRFAAELVRNGRIGELTDVEVLIKGNNIENPLDWQPMPVPAELDYDFWLGPAKEEPYTDARCHYNFRFILDYSGGQITNWGAHHIDIAQWALGADRTGPVMVKGQGIIPSKGLFTTPYTYDVTYTYENGLNLRCHTGGSGVRFNGTEGWIYVDRQQIATYPESLKSTRFGQDEVRLYQSADHAANFLECVKTRQELVAPAEIGHRTASMCHLGTIAVLTGEELQWDPKAERFLNSEHANRFLSKPRRTPWRL